MTYRVVFDKAAEDDLMELGEWIADRTSFTVAMRYLERLQSYCRRVDIFPQRGARRDDILPGLRTIGFERRVLIAFRVGDETVSIIRIPYGGQDIERALANDG